MKTTFKVRCCVAFGAVLCSSVAYGHLPPVHGHITLHAEACAYNYNDSSSYADFFFAICGDCNHDVAADAMLNGSEMEDLGSRPRCLNHFYDPLTGLGLSNVPYDDRARDSINGQIIYLGNDSFTWASTLNCPAFLIYITIVPLVTDTQNHWSWQNAREYEWHGLTDLHPGDRHTALTNMFRALGQTVHLLQDTTSPQHVRNEQHLLRFWSLIGWSVIENYGDTNVYHLNYQQSILDWRGAGFTKLEDFWNRHLYNGKD